MVFLLLQNVFDPFMPSLHESLGVSDSSCMTQTVNHCTAVLMVFGSTLISMDSFLMAAVRSWEILALKDLRNALSHFLPYATTSSLSLNASYIQHSVLNIVDRAQRGPNSLSNLSNCKTGMKHICNALSLRFLSGLARLYDWIFYLN